MEFYQGSGRKVRAPRAPLASLSALDRARIIERLDRALWWGTPQHLVVAVTALLCELDPDGYGVDRKEEATP